MIMPLVSLNITPIFFFLPYSEVQLGIRAKKGEWRIEENDGDILAIGGCNVK